MQKDCKKCGNTFQCQPNDIATCHCSKIKITKAQLLKLNNCYSDCLCATCLALFSTSEASTTT